MNYEKRPECLGAFGVPVGMNLYPFILQPPTPRNRLVRVVLVVVSTISCLDIARKDTTVRGMRQARILNSMPAHHL